MPQQTPAQQLSNPSPADSTNDESIPLLGFRWLIVTAYTLLITLLALLPNDAMPTLSLWDKLNHFAAYTVFVLLVAYCFQKRHSFRLGIIAILFYGVLIELTQHYVGREASLFDLIANLTGIAAACLLLKIVEFVALPPMLKPPFLSTSRASKQRSFND